MTELSPQAQAVLDAFLSEWDVYAISEARWATAAALCAAAYQVDPIEYEVIDNLQYEVRSPVRDALLAIAAELKGSN